MNNITIKLENNTLTGLAGDPLGYEISKTQVLPILKKTIDSNQKLTISIPKNIEDISISFVQGFLKAISKVLPKSKFYDFVEINGSEKALTDFKVGLEYRS